MKAKYKKFSKGYVAHLKSLPQNRHMQDYQKWVRKQREQKKQEKQICHVVFHFKVKKYNFTFGVEE